AQLDLSRRVEIRLLEFSLNEKSPEVMAAEILMKSPRLVGFSCYTWDIDSYCAVAACLRASCPDIRIVFGGPEASGRCEEFLRTRIADFVVCGEGEATFAELVRCLLDGGDYAAVQGLAYAGAAGPAINPMRPPIPNIESIPDPYSQGVVALEDGYSGPILLQTYRGCLFHCAYCNWPMMGSALRYFPVERVLSSVERILDRWPNSQLRFIDADLFVPRARAKKLFGGFQELAQGKPATWAFNINVASADEELAILSNCDHFKFGIGIQSTNAEVLALVNRSQDIPAFERRLAMFKASAPKAKIELQAIYGLPGDTLAQYRRTLEWLLRRQMNGLVALYPLSVLPGTELHREAVRLGLKHDQHSPFLLQSSPTLSPEDFRTASVLSFETRVLMDDAGIRQVLDLAANHDPGWSYVDFFEALRVRLADSGIMSFDEIYARSPEISKVNWVHWWKIYRAVLEQLEGQLDPAELKSFLRAHKEWRVGAGEARSDERLPEPRTAYLPMGAGCPNGCCELRRPRASDGLSKILSAASRRAGRVVLGGGDALLGKDLPHLLGIARVLRMRDLWLYTTARPLAGDKACAKLREESAVRGIVVPLFSCGEKEHDARVRVSGALRETRLGMLRWKKSGGSLTAWAFLDRSNVLRLSEWLGWMAEHGVSQALFLYRGSPPGWGEVPLSDLPAMRSAAAAIQDVLPEVGRRGISISVFGIPECLIPKEKVPSHELRGVFDEAVLSSGESEVLTLRRRKTLKTMPPACASCRRKDRCEGVWKDYLERHGGGEFHDR
ncbi:MAG: radical SAM protein, partial [Elusimicrobiota bacterium]